MRCVISCYTSSTFFCWKIVIASRLWPYLPHMHNNNNSNKNNNKNTKTNEWHNMCLTYFRYSHFVECAKNYMRIYIYWNHNLFVGVIGIKMISAFTGEFVNFEVIGNHTLTSMVVVTYIVCRTSYEMNIFNRAIIYYGMELMASLLYSIVPFVQVSLWSLVWVDK